MTTPVSTTRNVSGTSGNERQPWLTVKQEQIRQRWAELVKEKEKRMTSTEIPTTVDADGNVALDHMRAQWHFLEQLRAEREMIDLRIKQTEEQFQAAMRAANATGFTIDGLPKVTFKQNGTFASSVFKETEPAIFAAYQIPTTKLDLAALKRDRPELVQKFTPNRWVNVKAKRS